MRAFLGYASAAQPHMVVIYLSVLSPIYSKGHISVIQSKVISMVATQWSSHSGCNTVVVIKPLPSGSRSGRLQIDINLSDLSFISQPMELKDFSVRE